MIFGGKEKINISKTKRAELRRAVLKGFKRGVVYEVVVKSVNDMGESQPSEKKIVTIPHKLEVQGREHSLSAFNRALTRATTRIGAGLMSDNKGPKQKKRKGFEGWTDDMLYTGYITKLGGKVFKNWKKRFFILYSSRTFEYFDKPNGVRKGSGQFQGAVKHMEQEDGSVIFCATDSFGEKRKWHFIFENNREKAYWQNFAEDIHHNLAYNGECKIHVPEKHKKKQKAKKKGKKKRNKKLLNLHHRLQAELEKTELTEESTEQFEKRLRSRRKSKKVKKRSTLHDMKKALFAGQSPVIPILNFPCSLFTILKLKQNNRTGPILHDH